MSSYPRNSIIYYIVSLSILVSLICSSTLQFSAPFNIVSIEKIRSIVEQSSSGVDWEPVAQNPNPILATQREYGADEFFNDSYVHEIYISFNDSDWFNRLYQSHDKTIDDPYFPAMYEYQGTVINPIGIKMKGYTSFKYYPGDKKAFRLDFNMFQPGGNGTNETTFMGLKKLNLNNNYLDPTMMREKLLYDFASKYIVAPRSVFVRVFINGEYWGLYSAVEQIDKTFEQSRYGPDEDGNLWRTVKDCDLSYHGNETNGYNGSYLLRTNNMQNNWSKLIEICKILNSTPISQLSEKLEPTFDVDSWIWALAINNLFVNLDSYIGSAHNYYLYDRNDTGKLTHQIWDGNMAFGTLTKGMTPEEVNNRAELGPFWFPKPQPGEGVIERPLMERIWEVPQYRLQYLQAISQLLRDGFNMQYMEKRISQLADIIRPYVYNDTKKQFTNQDFDTGLTDDVLSGHTVIPGLLSLVNARATWMENKLDTFAQRTDIYLNELMTINTGVIKDNAKDSDPWLELYSPGPGNVNLSGLYLSDDSTNPGKWALPPLELDDGKYVIIWMDNEPMEGKTHTIFKLNAQGGNVYLYNRSGDNYKLTDSVSYPMLEKGVSYGRSVDGSGSWTKMHDHPSPAAQNKADDLRICINEFMADNKETVSCQNGNTSIFADWIEIYNGGSGTVDLSMMYLTDNLNMPRKWQFPAGTLIAPNGIVLVWADYGTSNGTLHTGFCLNASKEEIGFFADFGELTIDNVSFGQQLPDVSYGRYPDGTNDWEAMHIYPTPGKPNRPDGSIVISDKLFINELMAKNKKTIADPDSIQSPSPDWLELYNADNKTLDLTNMYLTNRFDMPKQWKIPGNMTIAPQQHMLFWADNKTSEGVYHMGFKLNANGEQLALFAADGATRIDSVVFGEQFSDVSYGRTIDGRSHFSHLFIPTPGRRNIANPPDHELPVAYAGGIAKVVIGEVVTFDGTASQDDIGIVSYRWSFVYNGSTVILNNSISNFVFNNEGVYSVMLTVTDSGGNTDTDTLIVKVYKTLSGSDASNEAGTRGIIISALFVMTVTLICLGGIKVREKLKYRNKGVFR